MITHPSKILHAPRITEKGAYLQEQGCYVFNIAQGVNKAQVAAAVQSIFKVTPRKVALVAVPRKRGITRGTNRTGQTRGGKKAYVFLKKGDKIELI